MNKKLKNSKENNSQTTSNKDHDDYINKGIYLRDDHCDWGSSGMNELTEQQREVNQFLKFSQSFKKFIKGA